MMLLTKLLSAFLAPLTSGLGLLVVGLMVAPRWRIWRRTALGAGLFLVLAFALQPVSNAMLEHLEDAGAAVAPRFTAGMQGFRWVVVLAGGGTSDPRLPLTSQVGSHSLMRLAQGIAVQRSIPGSKLLLSGGTVFGGVPESDLLASMAGSLGVPAADIVTEPRSRNTAEQAQFVSKIVGRDPFVLVTSASHVRRAVALFRARGTNPVVSATEHLAGTRWPALWFIPSGDSLVASQIAIHEYVGAAWAALRGET